MLLPTIRSTEVDASSKSAYWRGSPTRPMVSPVSRAALIGSISKLHRPLDSVVVHSAPQYALCPALAVLVPAPIDLRYRTPTVKKITFETVLLMLF